MKTAGLKIWRFFYACPVWAHTCRCTYAFRLPPSFHCFGRERLHDKIIFLLFEYITPASNLWARETKANMKFQNTALILVVVALAAGCAAPPPSRTYSPSAKAYSLVAAVPVTPSSVTHRFAVEVKDSAGQPVSGSTVKFVPGNNSTTKGETKECTTDAQGRCEYSVEVRRNQAYTYMDSYNSTIGYRVEKLGFFLKSGTISNSFGSETSLLVKSSTVIIYTANDYMADGFGSKPAERELREKAIRFLMLIQLQSLLNDAEVPLKAFNTSDFKGKRYFQLKLNSTTYYNSLKLNKYDIGKQLFDESLRKVLNPLNDHISNPKAFYGYDMIINGYSKSFTDKNAVAEKIEYRFLMPQDAVRRYKNKDISGQQLLDASVILMNDERIDMKLQ